MGQRTQTVLTDDLDGGEATQTVTFAFQGTSYEIDLNGQHASSIEESFSEWINAARKVRFRSAGAQARSSSSRTASSTGPKRNDLDDVRAWARQDGHVVADRGRVKQSILDAYDAAY